MPLLTIAGAHAIHARLTFPAQGAWRAIVATDGDTAPTGAVTLQVDALVLAGAVYRSGVFRGLPTLYVVGGGGGLSKGLPARAYGPVSIGVLLGDIAREAGEKVSTTIDPAVSSRVLPRWSRARGTAGGAIADLAELLGLVWRVLDDGSIWLGALPWTAASADLVVLERDRARGRAVVAAEDLALRPGLTLEGERVTLVEYAIASDRVRVEVELGGSTASRDRLSDSFARAVRGVMRDSVYAGAWRARVLSQNGDKTLELKVDDPRIPNVSKVPIRGLPGVQVTVAAGASCLLEFENADPELPIATLFEARSLVELDITASTKVVVNAPAIQLGAGDQLPIARAGDVVQVAIDATAAALLSNSGGPLVVAAPVILAGQVLTGSGKVTSG